MQVSKDFVFHFEGVNALFSKLRRAVEMISSLNSADLEPGGAAGGVVPLVTLDKAKDGKQKPVRKNLLPTPRHGHMQIPIIFPSSRRNLRKSRSPRRRRKG